MQKGLFARPLKQKAPTTWGLLLQELTGDKPNKPCHLQTDTWPALMAQTGYPEALTSIIAGV
jgi:hypothetical protein